MSPRAAAPGPGDHPGVVVTLRLVVVELETAAEHVYRRRLEARQPLQVPRVGDLVATGSLRLPGAAEPQPGLHAQVRAVLWREDLEAVTVTIAADVPGWASLAPGLDRAWVPSPR